METDGIRAVVVDTTIANTVIVDGRRGHGLVTTMPQSMSCAMCTRAYRSGGHRRRHGLPACGSPLPAARRLFPIGSGGIAVRIAIYGERCLRFGSRPDGSTGCRRGTRRVWSTAPAADRMSANSKSRRSSRRSRALLWQGFQDGVGLSRWATGGTHYFWRSGRPHRAASLRCGAYTVSQPGTTWPAALVREVNDEWQLLQSSAMHGIVVESHVVTARHRRTRCQDSCDSRASNHVWAGA